jgi:hypothetical protein
MRMLESKDHHSTRKRGPLATITGLSCSWLSPSAASPGYFRACSSSCYNITILAFASGGSACFMRWFTTNRKSGLLALAALALQMAVSCGHVHLDGIHPAPAAFSVFGAARQAAQSLPAPQPSDDGDDYCAICATIYLAANSFVPPAPQLPVPFVSQVIEHFDRIDVHFVTPRRAPFQSRAPPLI